MSQENSPRPTAWWRERWMWLVVGGPAVVVVAGFATLGLAIVYPDPVVQGTRVGADEVSAQPAMKARNHAATDASRPGASQP
ncbi:hypothetical protein ACG0Z6_14615 [Roseateles sp. BYS180W]|uniref:Nitrogen fixation protein FixH n=1 Tax=Roseateles rivi TaxID=3299028 RepID=A0ABW7FYN1_9BURK